MLARLMRDPGASWCKLTPEFGDRCGRQAHAVLLLVRKEVWAVAILLAILSTMSIAIGEFFAADTTKKARANEVTSTMFGAGVLMTAMLAILWPGDPTSRDLFFGAASGIANGAGVLLLYLAYSRGSLRSAAPAAAVVMSSVPVLWDVVISGARPSVLVWIGLVLGLAAIALSSYERADHHDAEDRAIGLAILAGVVFGFLFVLLNEIGEGAGGAPLMLQRSVGFVVAVAVTRATGKHIFPVDRRVRATAVVVGLFATTAIILMVVALQLGGSLSIVSVIGSQYAGVAVLLGFIFRGQRMWWWQTLGLVAASVAVALITVG